MAFYSNAFIAARIADLGKLLELSGENTFKTRAYDLASHTIGAYPHPLHSATIEELIAVPGLGKSMATRVMQIIENGVPDDYATLSQTIPAALLELTKIQGLGAKKILALWKDHGIDSPEALHAAFQDQRVKNFKGFATKSLESLERALEFFLLSRGSLRMDDAEQEADWIIAVLQSMFPDRVYAIGGQIHHRTQTVSQIDILYSGAPISPLDFPSEWLTKADALHSPQTGIALHLHHIEAEQLGYHLVHTSSSPDHWLALSDNISDNLPETPSPSQAFPTEESVYEAANWPYIIPPMRHTAEDWIKSIPISDIVTNEDIKGCLHNHSTYSDGKNSIREMAEACMALGLTYFGICDHSQSAAYAGGLKEEQIQQQWAEIDALNADLPGFKVFKGIESDILDNGGLDYPHEILSDFDMVVASVHSNLNMDLNKATGRLLAAIHNPYTAILGHCSGRLLLDRAGYPLDYEAIIQACIECQVAIEINASPWRLDMDWTHLRYAADQGALFSINPDAHHTSEIPLMRYGIYMAQRAGLAPTQILNCWPEPQLTTWLKERRKGK